MNLIILVILVTMIIALKEVSTYKRSAENTVNIWKKLIEKSMNGKIVTPSLIEKALNLRGEDVIKVYLAKGERLSRTEVIFYLVKTTILSTYYVNGHVVSVEPSVFNVTHEFMLKNLTEIITAFGPSDINVTVIPYEVMIEEIKPYRRVHNDSIIIESRNIRLK